MNLALNHIVNLLIILFVLTLVGNFDGYGQTFNSVDESSGTWSEDTDWDGGTAAPSTSSIQNLTINIDGFITRFGDINYSKKSFITVLSGDTLVIDGNVTLNNQSEVIVEDDAILVILGDFTSGNSLDISTTGSIVIVGEFEIGNAATVTNDGHIYIYDDTPTTGSSTTLPPSIEDETDLENNDPDLFAFVNGDATLPVNLVSFYAEAALNEVKLFWSTKGELNNNYFELRRSTNGKDFIILDEIKGHGTVSETKNYQYTDKQPVNGYNYYQINQIDFDGSETLSRLISVKAQTTTANFDVFPTVLTGNSFKIRISGIADGEASLQMYNLSGRSVFNQVVSTHSDQIEEFTIEPGELEAGIYIIVLKSGENTYKRKLIVNK